MTMTETRPVPEQHRTLGLYLHIPFCARKCDYCDFYSLSGENDRMDAYLQALCTHLRARSADAAHFEVDTVYFGGGTPSLFGGERLEKVLDTVRGCYSLSRESEITVECNPDSTTPELLGHLRRVGVNRLSIGVQSAVDSELAQIGRLHCFEQAAQCVRRARQAEFDNISLDLIYGLPGQTLDSWERSLEALIALNPEHLSCYGLKLEEGTPLWQRRERELLADDDTQADMYLRMVERLAREGYGQYEISNFARPGRESRHNLKYWLGEDYLGFGPAAHSCFQGRRYGFVRNLERYLREIPEETELYSECVSVTRRERQREYVMLRMRTAFGITAEDYEARFCADFAPLEQRLGLFARYGWAESADGGWHFTPEGFLRSTPLIADLLEQL